jgi:hypothetical protein
MPRLWNSNFTFTRNYNHAAPLALWPYRRKFWARLLW